MKLKNKNIVILGLGRSGISLAKFLNKKNAKVKILDINKKIKINKIIKNLILKNIKIKLGPHKISDLKFSDLIIISPGIPTSIPILKKIKKYNIPLIGEIEFASNLINKPIIAVTGTNGKTTTVKLIREIFIKNSKKTFLCGNIGIPVTESLYKLKNIEIIIIEVSSFQLDTVKKFKATTAVLLNINKDHLDRYNNFKDYIKSKNKIFYNQSKKDTSIFNNIQKNIINLKKIKSFKIPVSCKPIKHGAQILNNNILIFKNKKIMLNLSLKKTKLIGHHNKENIASAIMAVLSNRTKKKDIQYTINNFKPYKHRIEVIKFHNGLTFIDDSKATNLSALKTAIKCFYTPIILIIGGELKKTNFNKLKYNLSKKIKIIIIIGINRNKIKEKLKNKNIKIKTTEKLENAVKIAIKNAKYGYTILLSPGCSSFDQFKNYKERGNKFKESIEKIIKN